MIFRWGVSPERKVRGVMTTSALASITAIRCCACDMPGLDVDLPEPLDRGAGSPFSVSSIAAIANWACAAGSLPGNLLRSGCQAAIAWSGFFSVW